MSLPPTAIIVLGAPNDEHGALSSLARERCEQALKEYRRQPDASVIATGGWGAHFNTTSQPHAHYAREYLKTLGIPAAAFVECAESSNTFEDARLCRPIVARHGFTRLVVVTSDFHVARARWIFQREFPALEVEFSASSTHLPAAELQARIQHEQAALARLAQSSE